MASSYIKSLLMGLYRGPMNCVGRILLEKTVIRQLIETSLIIKQPEGLFLRVYETVNPYPTAFPYGNGMVLHFYQQQESSTTKTVHKVINKGLKAYV